MHEETQIKYVAIADLSAQVLDRLCAWP